MKDCPSQRHLPEPGIDVFVSTEEFPTMRFARLESNRKFFVVPRAYVEGTSAMRVHQLPARDVIKWDYAVPAGDLL